VAAALVVLYRFDPSQGGFPACPFRSITGLLCPGCGSQRAVHDLMHLQVGRAFHHNALLVLAIPALLFQWAWDAFAKPQRPLASHNLVVLAWALAIIGWGVVRNL
jgi:hypothetical protein